MSQSKYSALRIVTIIEPDSLPKIVTNQSDANCVTETPFYEQGVAYARDKLHAIPYVYTYVDAAHVGGRVPADVGDARGHVSQRLGLHQHQQLPGLGSDWHQHGTARRHTPDRCFDLHGPEHLRQ